MMNNKIITTIVEECCRFGVYIPIVCFLIYISKHEMSLLSIGLVTLTLLIYRVLVVFVNPNNPISMKHLRLILIITLGSDIINQTLQFTPIKYFVGIMNIFLIAYGMWRFDVNLDLERERKVK